MPVNKKTVCTFPGQYWKATLSPIRRMGYMIKEKSKTCPYKKNWSCLDEPMHVNLATLCMKQMVMTDEINRAPDKIKSNFLLQS